jgi:hypothetical protein
MREVPIMVPSLAAVAAIIPASLFGALVGCVTGGPPGFLLGGVIAGGAGALLAKRAELHLARTGKTS